MLFLKESVSASSAECGSRLRMSPEDAYRNVCAVETPAPDSAAQTSQRKHGCIGTPFPLLGTLAHDPQGHAVVPPRCATATRPRNEDPSGDGNYLMSVTSGPLGGGGCPGSAGPRPNAGASNRGAGLRRTNTTGPASGPHFRVPAASNPFSHERT